MLAGLIRSLRPAQWVKNVFVLAPLLFSRRLADPEALLDAALAFVSFSLASSAVYLFNDIRDREADRLHPLKRRRPVAAGLLPVPVAGAAALALAALGLALAAALPPPFLPVVLAYLAINTLYSLGLKNVVILDVMLIAAGFLLRVIGGGLAIEVELSRWLLLCTIFLALFLAFSKRRHELQLLAESAADQRVVLRQYGTIFLDQMINVATASTVVTYALYVISTDTVEKFHTRSLIFTMPMVLFGIFRYLYLVYQKPGVKNPTEAVLSDPPSVVNVLLWIATAGWIIYTS